MADRPPSTHCGHSDRDRKSRRATPQIFPADNVVASKYILSDAADLGRLNAMNRFRCWRSRTGQLPVSEPSDLCTLPQLVGINQANLVALTRPVDAHKPFNRDIIRDRINGISSVENQCEYRVVRTRLRCHGWCGVRSERPLLSLQVNEVPVVAFV